MNKILVDNKNIFASKTNIFSSNQELFVDINNTNKKTTIEVLENIKTKITIIGNNDNLELEIKLNKNSNLTLNIFLIDSSINIKTDLFYMSNLILNNSILNSIDSDNHIIINHLEDKSVSNIRNHGYSKNKAKLVFNIEGNIIKKANKCICNQDNQIIENENSFSTILPILLIDNYDVEASHSAYVGEFKEKELFYLQSRGISLEDSKFLLLNAFLLGILHINQEGKSELEDRLIKYLNKEV